MEMIAKMLQECKREFEKSVERYLYLIGVPRVTAVR